jgi:hypothetical protein
VPEAAPLAAWILEARWGGGALAAAWMRACLGCGWAVGGRLVEAPEERGAGWGAPGAAADAGALAAALLPAPTVYDGSTT